jgi:guanosine-3',5'-bis(diphosphate) 3'-pyrophosphohydrolase
MSDIALILRAADFAADRHREQTRKGESQRPYIGHCIEVASLLANVGRVVDDHVLVAALLHDTVEDTDTTRDEIANVFSLQIADLVMEVTEDKSLAKKERKEKQIQHAPGLSDSAKLVKLADKIANVREIATDPPKKWKKKRRRQYFDWAESVVDAMGDGLNAELEALFSETLNKGRLSLGESKAPEDETEEDAG